MKVQKMRAQGTNLREVAVLKKDDLNLSHEVVKDEDILSHYKYKGIGCRCYHIEFVLAYFL